MCGGSCLLAPRRRRDWHSAARERLRGRLISQPLAYARGTVPASQCSVFRFIQTFKHLVSGALKKRMQTEFTGLPKIQLNQTSYQSQFETQMIR
jgi:hypothetical protein